MPFLLKKIYTFIHTGKKLTFLVICPLRCQQYCWSAILQIILPAILLNQQYCCQYCWQFCWQYCWQYCWFNNIADNIAGIIADYSAILMTILLDDQQYCWQYCLSPILLGKKYLIYGSILRIFFAIHCFLFLQIPIQ